MFAMGPGFFQQSGSSYATLALTGAFAAATVGVAYSSSIPITGGLEPYSLTGGTGIASGSLDTGFALSITGTTGARFLTLTCASPATADTMSFTASIGSTDGQTATSAQSVSVSAPSSATDDFSTNTIASYTEYANVSIGWYVDTTAGGAMLQTGSNESVLTRNGVSFADGHVSMVTSQASDSGLALRLLDKNNYYLAVIKDGSHTPGNVVIVYKRIGGTFTQLGSSAISFPINTAHSLAFSANGSSLVASFDGTPVVTVTDTSIAAAGKCGMRSGSTSTGLNPFNSFTWSL